MSTSTNSGLNRKQYEALLNLSVGLGVPYTSTIGASFNQQFCELCFACITHVGGTPVPVPDASFATRKAAYLQQLAIAMGGAPLGGAAKTAFVNAAKAIYDLNNDGGIPVDGSNLDWRAYELLRYSQAGGTLWTPPTGSTLVHTHTLVNGAGGQLASCMFDFAGGEMIAGSNYNLSPRGWGLNLKPSPTYTEEVLMSAQNGASWRADFAADGTYHQSYHSGSAVYMGAFEKATATTMTTLEFDLITSGSFTGTQVVTDRTRSDYIFGSNGNINELWALPWDGATYGLPVKLLPATHGYEALTLSAVDTEISGRCWCRMKDNGGVRVGLSVWDFDFDLETWTEVANWYIDGAPTPALRSGYGAACNNVYVETERTDAMFEKFTLNGSVLTRTTTTPFANGYDICQAVESIGNGGFIGHGYTAGAWNGGYQAIVDDGTNLNVTAMAGDINAAGYDTREWRDGCYYEYDGEWYIAVSRNDGKVELWELSYA